MLWERWRSSRERVRVPPRLCCRAILPIAGLSARGGFPARHASRTREDGCTRHEILESLRARGLLHRAAVSLSIFPRIRNGISRRSCMLSKPQPYWSGTLKQEQASNSDRVMQMLSASCSARAEGIMKHCRGKISSNWRKVENDEGPVIRVGAGTFASAGFQPPFGQLLL